MQTRRPAWRTRTGGRALREVYVVRLFDGRRVKNYRRFEPKSKTKRKKQTFRSEILSQISPRRAIETLSIPVVLNLRVSDRDPNSPAKIYRDPPHGFTLTGRKKFEKHTSLRICI